MAGQILDQRVDLLGRNAGHGDEVALAVAGGEPPLRPDGLGWGVEHDGEGVRVPPRGPPDGAQLGDCELGDLPGVVEAAPQPGNSVLVDRVPNHERCVAGSGAADGGVW